MKYLLQWFWRHVLTICDTEYIIFGRKWDTPLRKEGDDIAAAPCTTNEIVDFNIQTFQKLNAAVFEDLLFLKFHSFPYFVASLCQSLFSTAKHQCEEIPSIGLFFSDSVLPNFRH